MLKLFSPAKINLFLRVVSKRLDGYHDLSSVFQAITLGDTLTIELHPHDQLTCTDSRLPTDQSNLILKTTELFRRKTGSEQAFSIHLLKRIPIQAGLGGGSSNAATTLWACNQLTKQNIPLHILKEWSAEIGSDVPFFFSEGTAYCTGRGENVYPLSALAPCSLWMIKPHEGLSTPEVFRRLNFNPSHSENSSAYDLENFLSGSLLYFNDLEQAAFKIKPELEKLKIELLQRGFKTVVMTGSGSAFFCLGEGNPPSQSRGSVFFEHFMNRVPNHWYQEPV